MEDQSILKNATVIGMTTTGKQESIETYIIMFMKNILTHITVQWLVLGVSPLLHMLATEITRFL